MAPPRVGRWCVSGMSRLRFQEATRIAEERIKEMFRVTGFDPDEVFWVHGFQRGR